MTIVLSFNHLNTIIYTKLCIVSNFMPNKKSLNDFKRVSTEKALNTLKMELSMQFQAYDYCFQF